MGDSVVNIVCGDCGSADCQWASINRGLLVCNECSFIHRSLGCQYSRVKSLVHSKWHPNLKKMVTTLASGPANNVWEHTLLLDPSKSDQTQIVKKPVPGDSLEIVKKRFITLKHGQFQFVLRQKSETFDERNEELHSTVRTGDLGTVLRLIASGADPNFFHPERGTRPLHVACRSGQALQVELLFVHGAQIDAPDYLGQTPGEHAMAAGFKELAMRIEELRYHLTDQLSLFACGESPDHSTVKHILIPTSISVTWVGHEEKIKALPSYMLEQLAADLYDEVDRRQTEKILITSSPDHARFSIAFLPVNSNFPSVRNQTRQKFARLTDSELSSLIIAVLRESKRRHCNDSTAVELDKDIFIDDHHLHVGGGGGGGPSIVGVGSTPSFDLLKEDDEFPLYDSVASDDDVVMSEIQTVQVNKISKAEEVVNNPNLNSIAAYGQIQNTNATTQNNSNLGKRAENSSYLMNKLSEERIQDLENSNQTLKYELKVVTQMLKNSLQENLATRLKVQQNFEMDRLNSNNIGLDSMNSNCGSVGAEVLRINASTSPSFNASGGGVNNSNIVLRQHSPSALNSKLKRLRSVSMYAEKIDQISPSSSSSQNDGLPPVRPSMSTGDASTSLMTRRRQSNEMSNLVQATTRDIVELIKILIEYARSNDYQGVQLTANKIYDAALEMSTILIEKEATNTREEAATTTTTTMRSSLENVLFQVLRMKSEIPLLRNPSLLHVEATTSVDNRKDEVDNANSLYLQKIKRICFDVGASMRELVSTVVPNA